MVLCGLDVCPLNVSSTKSSNFVTSRFSQSFLAVIFRMLLNFAYIHQFVELSYPVSLIVKCRHF